MQIRTVRGYDFYEVSSTLQKAIRRADTALAGYFAIEMFESGYHNYVWKRLFTISAEDCHGVISQEIDALFNGFNLVNANKKKGEKMKGRIFIAKAVMVLCWAKKNRDADHLTNYVYDKKMVEESRLEEYLNQARQENKAIPNYAEDCHTIAGKIAGKTKEQFFKDELAALNPREPGLFDELIVAQQAEGGLTK